MLQKSDWWGYFLSGLVALGFGLIALVYKAAPFKSIAIAFSAFAVIKGIVDLIASMKVEKPFWRRVGASAEIIIGLLAYILMQSQFFADAGWSAVLGVWALIVGLSELLSAVQLRQVMDKEWIFLLTGVISIGFGLMILGDPLRAAFLPLNFMIGLYSVVWGIALIVLSFRVHKLPELEPASKSK